MAVHEDRERFIPLNTSEVIEMLSKELSGEQRELFQDLSLLLENIIHYEYQEDIEELEGLYFPFDPDTDKVTLKELPDEELRRMERSFYSKISDLLNNANFNRVDREEIEYALEEDSEVAVDVDVDLDEFDRLMIFKRGDVKRKETIPRFFSIFKKFFKKEIELDIYERMVMIIKFSPSYDPEKTTLKKDVQKDKTHLKTFKNVPRQDIEMILPNPRVKMSLVDKLKIGIPVLIGIGAGAAKFLKIIEGASSTLVTASVLVALGGYMIKSYVSYKNTILDYVKNLTSGLYFKNLGNNESVMHYLTNEAEEEEMKEAILGYRFILQSQGITTEELDDAVEEWFEDRDIYIDWEVEDALQKLERLELIEKREGNWHALPLQKALEHLDYIWDHHFKYGVQEQ